MLRKENTKLKKKSTKSKADFIINLLWDTKMFIIIFISKQIVLNCNYCEILLFTY